MDPRIVDREDAMVLGTLERINPMQADYSELWRDFMRYDDVVASFAMDKTYYAVYYGTGDERKADHLAGMVVGAVADIPAGLTLRPLPGGRYAAFDATMAAIGPTWQDIYARWLPASEYVEDESRPCFEHYTSDDTGPNAPVTIYVAIKNK